MVPAESGSEGKARLSVGVNEDVALVDIEVGEGGEGSLKEGAAYAPAAEIGMYGEVLEVGG